MPKTMKTAITVGATAPDVIVQSAERGQTLAGLRGSPVVVVFLAEQWDPAQSHLLHICRQVMQSLPDGGSLVSITFGKRGCEMDFSDRESVEFPIAGNLGEDAAAAFGVSGRRAVFVVDPQGVVCWRHISSHGEAPDLDDMATAVGRARDTREISRRELLAIGMAASICLALVAAGCGTGAKPETTVPETIQKTFALDVNGQKYQVSGDPTVTLLDALRERLGLTGTKKGCDQGQCGACTVHVDGRRVNACLTLAAQAEGSKITTVEGLANNGILHPVQVAFIKHDGFQCGYCTPGQIMSAVACIREGHIGSEADIKEWMSGNICRCGAYPGICAAIREASITS